MALVTCPSCGRTVNPNSRGVRSHEKPEGGLCDRRDFNDIITKK